MATVGETFKGIGRIREHCSEDEQKVLDNAVSIIKNMAISLSAMKEKQVDIEQIRWERNTAKNQLKDMGLKVGENIWCNVVDGKPESRGMYYVKLTDGRTTAYDVVYFDGKRFVVTDSEYKGYEIVKWMKLIIDNTSL